MIHADDLTDQSRQSMMKKCICEKELTVNSIIYHLRWLRGQRNIKKAKLDKL